MPLFLCYELSSWGLVTLYGGMVFFLRRKAVTILEKGEFGGWNLRFKMLEAILLEVSPDQRRFNKGFKAWMGSSLLSLDEEDEPESFMEASQLDHIGSTKQRV